MDWWTYLSRPARTWCRHPTVEPRFREKTNSVYRQCLTCGHAIGTAIRRDKFGELEFFDEDHADRYDEERRRQDTKEKQEWAKRYSEYLASPEWRQLRLRVLARDRVCRGCLGGPATEVHHLSYMNVGREWAFELIGLCRECHSSLHGHVPA